jgi:hypothetical protein
MERLGAGTIQLQTRAVEDGRGRPLSRVADAAVRAAMEQVAGFEQAS